MDKFKTFINNIMEKFNIWNQDCEYLSTEWRYNEEYDIAFTMEVQTIIHLNRQVVKLQEHNFELNEMCKAFEVEIAELEEKVAYCKDVIKTLDKKIVELNAEIELKDARMQKELDYKVKKAREITKLQEHIDCLENNPFRRIYNWVTGIVKYRVKLVKIGDNK